MLTRYDIVHVLQSLGHCSALLSVVLADMLYDKIIMACSLIQTNSLIFERAKILLVPSRSDNRELTVPLFPLSWLSVPQSRSLLF